MTTGAGIAYRRGYKYQLAEPFQAIVPVRPERNVATLYVHLSREGALFIKTGYAWDGPSGPAIDTANFMRGSLVHDALYQLMRLGHLDRARWRDPADELLRALCLEDGMSAARAWWVYAGVKTFAARAAMPSSEPPILRAP